MNMDACSKKPTLHRYARAGMGHSACLHDSEEPELVAKVREGDFVVMPAGYHPNVAAPGGPIGFLWMMAAHTEVDDRQFGVVNVHPAYAAGGSGFEASHGTK